jgi:hypothetical protein
MGRKKGICTLCGKGGKLTFEHVPAEASGNLRGVTMYNLEEWLARETATGKMAGGVIQPEGMGVVALCQECNGDLLGTHYVPSFIKFVEAGKEMLGGVGLNKIDELNKRDRATTADVIFLSVNRLAVIKQIVSMLLVTSGREVVAANPELERFVQDPKARGLPPRYRIFIALTAGPVAKATGLSGIVDTDTGAHAVAAEVVYPPFSYVLAFNGAEIYPVGEITHWANAEYGVESQEPLRIVIGFVHTAFPADLRSWAHIKADEADNLKQGVSEAGLSKS